MSDRELPTTIGPYEVLGIIGQGGMAIVYKARQPDLDRIVAIKVLLPDFADDPAFREQFQREARLVARLRHPHLVRVYEAGEDGAMPFLVMEYLPGPTLHAALVQRRRAGQVFSPAETLKLMRPLADALDYAHRHNVIHRDLKPENIILTDRGPVITDFGLARLMQEQAAAGSPVMGTPAYMSPEQIAARPVDARTDVYGLGILLYELLTGHVPFRGAVETDITYAHLHRAPPALADMYPRLRPWSELDRVVRRAVAKQPGDRWPSAGTLAGALEGAVDAAPTRLAREYPSGATWRLPARRRLERAVMVFPIVAFLFGGVWAVRSWARPADPADQRARPALVPKGVAEAPPMEVSETEAPDITTSERALIQLSTPTATALPVVAATSPPVAEATKAPPVAVVMPNPTPSSTPVTRRRAAAPARARTAPTSAPRRAVAPPKPAVAPAVVAAPRRAPVARPKPAVAPTVVAAPRVAPTPRVIPAPPRVAAAPPRVAPAPPKRAVQPRIPAPQQAPAVQPKPVAPPAPAPREPAAPPAPESAPPPPPAPAPQEPVAPAPAPPEQVAPAAPEPAPPAPAPQEPAAPPAPAPREPAAPAAPEPAPPPPPAPAPQEPAAPQRAPDVPGEPAAAPPADSGPIALPRRPGFPRQGLPAIPAEQLRSLVQPSAP